METRIKAIMAAILGIDPATIGPDTTTETVEDWDSFNQMNLAIALEQEFNLEIPVDDILLLTSYPAIVDCIERVHGSGFGVHG